MLPTNRVSTHPGELLRRMYLDEMGITQTAFAKHCGMSLQRLNEIISGKRGVTAVTAWLFAQALGTTPEFWMNLQAAHELTTTRRGLKVSRLSGARPIAGRVVTKYGGRKGAKSTPPPESPAKKETAR